MLRRLDLDYATIYQLRKWDEQIKNVALNRYICYKHETMGPLNNMYSYCRILKTNSSWSPTWAKVCQLIVRFFVILPQLNLTKLKFDYLKSGLKGKKQRYKHRRYFFTSLEFDYFRVQFKFAFRLRPLKWCGMAHNLQKVSLHLWDRDASLIRFFFVQSD